MMDADDVGFVDVGHECPVTSGSHGAADGNGCHRAKLFHRRNI